MTDINYEISFLELRLRGVQQLLTQLTKKYDTGIETRYDEPTAAEIQVAAPGYTQAALNAAHYKQWDTIKLLQNASLLSNLFKNNANITEFIGCNWIVDKAIDLSGMFQNCTNLVRVDLSGWFLTNNKSLANMFSGCTNLEYVNLSEWQTSDALTDLSGMFSGCVKLKSLDLHGWDVSKVTKTTNMFKNCANLSYLNLQGWDTSKLEDATGMFDGCISITSLDLSGWNTSSIQSITGMFQHCISLQSLNLSNWSFTNDVTSDDPPTIFQGCVNLQKLILNNCASSILNSFGPYPQNIMLDTLVMNNCTYDSGNDVNNFVKNSIVNNIISQNSMLASGVNYSSLFADLTCKFIDLTALNLNGTNVSAMFQNCARLSKVVLSQWTNMSVPFFNLDNMFNGCLSLNTIDIHGWNLTSASFNQAFQNCSTLTSINMNGVKCANPSSVMNVFTNDFNLKTISITGCITVNPDGSEDLTTVNAITSLFANTGLTAKVVSHDLITVSMTVT